MTIHPAASTDFENVRALLEAVGLPHEDLTPPHMEHFLVCRDGDALRGIVGLEPFGTVALLRSLAVVPAHRNEGLGTRLTEAIERRAHRQAIRTLYLLTTRAAPYFRCHDYEVIGRGDLPEAIQQTEEARRLCPSSATCMRKVLRTMDEARA